MFFRIAFRNLMRHRTRTLILGGAIGSVAFLLTFLIALVAGVKSTMIRNGTALMTGHVNIAGFYKMSQSSALPLVTEFPTLLEIAKREVPEAKLIIDRMKAYGKVISDRDSLQLPLWGVRMEQEQEVLAKLELAEPKDYIEDLDTNTTAIPPQKGSLQDLGSKSSIALFASQAKKLKVRVGDMVTISLPTYRNMSNTKDVKVVAVLKDLGLMSQFSAYAHTDDTLEIYQLKETTTGQIMIFLQDINQVPGVEERLRKAIANAGYEVLEKDPNPFFFKFDRNILINIFIMNTPIVNFNWWYVVFFKRRMDFNFSLDKVKSLRFGIFIYISPTRVPCVKKMSFISLLFISERWGC